MQTKAKIEFPDSHRWIVFSVICSIYILVYFHRVSTSVIATDLLAAFQTNAAALGFMSSMYFYLYAVEQPLVGYLSDRLGPRRVVVLWSLIASPGLRSLRIGPIHWMGCRGPRPHRVRRGRSLCSGTQSDLSVVSRERISAP